MGSSSWSGVFAAAKRGKDVIVMITCFCISQQVWLLSDAWAAEQWLQFSLLALSLTFGFIPAWLGVSTHLCHREFSTVSCFTQKSWNYLLQAGSQDLLYWGVIIMYWSKSYYLTGFVLSYAFFMPFSDVTKIKESKLNEFMSLAWKYC